MKKLLKGSVVLAVLALSLSTVSVRAASTVSTNALAVVDPGVGASWTWADLAGQVVGWVAAGAAGGAVTAALVGTPAATAGAVAGAAAGAVSGAAYYVATQAVTAVLGFAPVVNFAPATALD